MVPRKPTESDIIDVLLGQADPNVEAEVHDFLRSDRDFSDAYTAWSRVRPALKEERERGKTAVQNACSTIMARIRAEEQDDLVCVPHRWGKWRHMAVLVAVLAIVVGLSMFALFSQSPAPSSQISMAPASGSGQGELDSVVYVAFNQQEKGGRGLGTQADPHRTLRDALDVVGTSGTIRIRVDAPRATSTETLRLTRPVRIEAVNGDARIGAS